MVGSKVQEILEGWKNYTFPNPEVEVIAKERAAICGVCEFNKGRTCGKCGCLLAAKCRSMKSSCPINKWSKVEEK